MYALVAAASAAYLGASAGVMLDASEAELNAARASMSNEVAVVDLASMPQFGDVTMLESRGTFPSGTEMASATALARDACTRIAEAMAACLTAAFERELARAAKRAEREARAARKSGTGGAGGAAEDGGERKKKKKSKKDKDQ
jgi:hypothetical protein